MHFTTPFILAAGALIASAQAKTYTYYNYGGFVNAIQDLEQRFPDIVEVFDAQSKYGLESPGDCGGTPCKNYVIRLGKRAVQDKDTPEVFFSGALHGNERVGPNAVMEFAIYMAEAYNGIGNSAGNPWIKRLIETRSMYIIPTTNVLGYHQNRREENGIDPNRDFAYNQNPDECMKSITARVVNELWREHMFQLAVTFHGGIHMITTEWGSYNHYSDSKSEIPPDDQGQLSVAAAMGGYAGAFDEGVYPHGRSSDILYPVYGGMEDWGYAASWEPNPPCTPNTYGGYPESQTTYEPHMIRAFNILVETSRSKAPSERDFGNDNAVLKPAGNGDGHIPRNMRVAMLVADLVQPYLQFVAPEEVAPAQCSGVKFPADNTPFDAIPSSLDVARGQPVSFGWEVGGSLIVDETFLMWGPWPASGAFDASAPGFGLSPAQLNQYYSQYDTASGLCTNCGRSGALSGFSRWGGGGKFGSGGGSDNILTGSSVNVQADVADRDAEPYVAAFSACATMPTTPGDYFVMARAKVDQAWADQPKTTSPRVGPQTHVVNARTNEDYEFNTSTNRVRGQKNWYSVPIRVTVTSDGTVITSPPSTPSTPSAPPTQAPSPGGVGNEACECDGGNGSYEQCVFYSPLSANVCYIKFNGGQNDEVPCAAPPGGEFRYSTNSGRWYVLGCELDDSRPSQGEDYALITGEKINEEDVIPNQPAPASSPVALVAGVAAGVVGLTVVVAAVLVRRSKSEPTPAPSKGDEGSVVAIAMDTPDEEGASKSMVSDNPMFA